MAINNPQSVKYCNEKIRTVADQLAQVYYSAKAVVDEWNAQNMGAIITIDGGNIIDGSLTDGRPIITGNDVQLLIINLNGLISEYEASDKSKLNSVLKIAPNPVR